MNALLFIAFTKRVRIKLKDSCCCCFCVNNDEQYSLLQRVEKNCENVTPQMTDSTNTLNNS